MEKIYKFKNNKGVVVSYTEEEMNELRREGAKTLQVDITKLIVDKHLLGSIFVDSTKEMRTDVPLAAMSLATKNFKLIINPLNYPKLPQKQRLGVLFHELMHYINKHPKHYRYFKKTEKDTKRFNYSTDFEINEWLPGNSYMELPKGVLRVSEFNERYQLNMEYKQNWLYYEPFVDEIFEKMKDKQDEQGGNSSDSQQSDSSSGDGSESQQSDGSSGDGSESQQSDSSSGSEQDKPGEEKGSGGDSESDFDEFFYDEGGAKDSHEFWEDGEANKEERVLKESLKKAMQKNKDDLSNNPGRYPADFKQKILEVIEDNVEYRGLLANVSAKYLRSNRKRTYARENRNLLEAEVGYFARGNKTDGKKKCLIIKDTSGSIDKRDYAVMNGHAKKLALQRVDITIMDVDADVQRVYPFNPKKGLESQATVQGGGGTSFIPPFNYIVDNKMEFDLIIYLTDGYGTAPDDFHIPTIWVILEGGACPRDSRGRDIKWRKGHVIYSKTKN